MSVETKSESSWTSDSLQLALRQGKVVVKDNNDGKAECWKKFKLVETADGLSVFGWAACADCFCCIMFKLL